MASINRTAIERGHARESSETDVQRYKGSGSMAFLFDHERVFEDTDASPWGPYGALRLPPGTESEAAARA